MGVQALYDDPVAFANSDPHFFDFVLATLHGK